ncbi:UvrD-helicase domain-containing protein, partial [Nocardia wallacei]|uniref:UvrD-helicase domain-containing protein n=1 Tax=Nocardia wallacei TaxID=480035 RepID=UPI003CC7F289
MPRPRRIPVGARLEVARGPGCGRGGAGTGMTRTNTHRIAFLVGAGIGRAFLVLAVTFTARAAG